MQIIDNLISSNFLMNTNIKQEALSEVNNSSSFEELLLKVTSKEFEANDTKYGNVPYGYLAQNGVINYNGATFVCDSDNSRLCLGDVSDSSKCISIPLSNGGSLVVNRDNLEQLAGAIDMFSPEDINRIMKAISMDKKCKSEQFEIDEQKSGIGATQNKNNEGHSDQEESDIVLNDRWTIERSNYEYNYRWNNRNTKGNRR